MNVGFSPELCREMDSLMRSLHVARNLSGLALSALLCAVVFVSAGCGKSDKPKGVVIPAEEQFDPNFPINPDMRNQVNAHIRNLTFDKPQRTLKAAENLAKKGADAVRAVPWLKEYSEMETDSAGFPSDEQREAFKKAIVAIETDAKAKGVAVPTAKDDISLNWTGEGDGKDKGGAAPPAAEPKKEEPAKEEPAKEEKKD